MLLLLFSFVCAAPFMIYGLNLTPICRIETPCSVLLEKEKHAPLYIGDRVRYSTCTGVTWFHEKYLAVINLYGNRIDTYEFDSETKTCIHLQEITNEHGAQLGRPENITISPDGRYLVVSSDYPKPGVILYEVDEATHYVKPHPFFRVVARGLTHNAHFSANGRYLATAGWNHKTAVCVYRIDSASSGLPRLILASVKKNPDPGLVSKLVHFTSNGRFAIVSHSVKAAFIGGGTVRAAIEVYEFDQESGKFGQLVSSLKHSGLEFCYEDLIFLNNETQLLFTDQNNDRFVMYSFDPEAGIIYPEETFIEGKSLGLDFPHGMSLSSNKKFLAVTNYGDDSCMIYEIGI